MRNAWPFSEPIDDSVQQSEFHECVVLLPKDIGQGDHGVSSILARVLRGPLGNQYASMSCCPWRCSRGSSRNCPMYTSLSKEFSNGPWTRLVKSSRWLFRK